MSHAEDPAASRPGADADRLEDTVRQLVLMKETGPKSAAWHRARVSMIWRLHRRIAVARQTESPPAAPVDEAEPPP
jgi:hypothetical protein